MVFGTKNHSYWYQMWPPSAYAFRMARPRNVSPSEDFHMRVPPGLAHALDVLARRGLLGTSAPEVAKYLLTQRIQEMVTEGSLAPDDAQAQSVGNPPET
jgi:hypothetical protein